MFRAQSVIKATTIYEISKIVRIEHLLADWLSADMLQLFL